MNLKDVLRKGDPAAEDLGLSPEEIQAMRRTVLAAVPEPRRRGWLIPVAAAAALILAVLIGLSLWRQPAPVEPAPVEAARRPEPSPPQPSSPTSPPPSLGEGGAHGRTAVARGSVGAPLSRREGRRGGRGVGGEGPKPEPAVAVATAEPQTQQIQFSTPGGTRVIWVLNRTTE